MTRIPVTALITLVFVTLACGIPVSAAAPPGFEPLFNGHDFNGWHGLGHFDPRDLAAMTQEERGAKHAADLEDMRQHWTIENGEIVNDGHGVYLTSDREFGDCELLIEYRTVPLADSGIYLRLTPQVQIWDTTDTEKFTLGADKGSGALWNNSEGAAGKDPLVLADQPFGEWNRMRIRQVGSRTSVWMNDQLVVNHAVMENFWDRSRPLFAKGSVQLQTHGGEIRWRNLYVREIPPDEANRILADKNDAGFNHVFNGRDLVGWQGATGNYEVVSSAVRCKPNSGGTLFTAKQYGNFAARLEFKLPPGGNNGLAIRYPGHGNPAYDGMCELQVLDNDSPKYTELDKRQYHGSAYGMTPAVRGYLRPPGTWNFQETTVRGSTIRVELNGYVILDTDLSQVTEFMGESPHPGKDLERGHFGFAGHRDPVEFRNIAIREDACN